EAAANGRKDVTPASIVIDEPETFEFDDQVWTPENYERTYDGPITLRHALAHSRNLATIHVAQAAGYDRVAALWKKLGVGNPPKAYPSIALGVFEATPYEIATAYTLFPNGGVLRPLKHILRITSGGSDANRPAGPSGSQPALPTWRQFMTRALAGHASVPFDVPAGIAFVDIDPETGKLATPNCPRVFREAFLAGTEPLQVCDVHRVGEVR